LISPSLNIANKKYPDKYSIGFVVIPTNNSFA